MPNMRKTRCRNRGKTLLIMRTSTCQNTKVDEIMRLARRLPLTRQVLADQLETATPAQMEFVDRWMNAVYVQWF